MGEIRVRVLCKQGDITLTWNVDDADAVERAKGEFARMKRDGYEFFEEAGGKRVKGWSAKRGTLLAVPGVQHKEDKPIHARGGAPRQRQKAMAGGPVAGVSRSRLWDTVVEARIVR